VFVDWWAAGLDAGLVVYLEARAATGSSGVLGGLLLYRHGNRLSTVHSADAPGVRDTHPGVMHLLRWRAIQLAIREGCDEMDLGGVDTGPDHREPGDGDPMAGLYEHKRSFGARWVAMTGAHQRVLRPSRYAIGRVAARVDRLVSR
jgi:lipid II:glycine glycyltransferase (peptidoglycan interpeptide bridge formation enzyme)